MGCVASTFLEEEEGAAAGSSSGPFRHHIVSLTSTTYGLLTTLDNPSSTPPHSSSSPSLQPPPPPPPPPPPLLSRSPLRLRSEPEVINSWELMEDLDATLSPTTPPPSKTALPESRQLPALKPFTLCSGKANANSSFTFPVLDTEPKHTAFWLSNAGIKKHVTGSTYSLETFEYRCPPGGDDSVVIYTTTLRGIRKTFEDCNAVRAAIEGQGVWFKERDVSMDMGFREELRELMKGSRDGSTVPRAFVRGRYIGGAEQVLRILEEGGLSKLLEGLPRAIATGPCDGCGGARFLPCFSCNGARKVVVVVVEGGREKGTVVRCPECNENGLVLCPICC